METREKFVFSTEINLYKCTTIPYTDQKIPEQAKVKTHKVAEKNQMVLMWYDADGRDPWWDLPEIPEV